MTSSAAFWCALYLGMLLIVGYGVVVWLASDRSGLEIFGQAACLGPAVTGWWLIAWSLLGHTPSLASVSALCGLAVVSVVCAVLFRRRRIFAPAVGQQIPLWIQIVTLLVVLSGAGLVGRDALIAPTDEWDAFVTWQLKAKVLASQPLAPRPDYFSNKNLSYSHLRYPILYPMICAGAMEAIGSDKTGLEKSPALLLYIGMAAAVFGGLRRMRGGRIACWATILFCTLPRLPQLGGTGTAEMALIAFFVCSLDNLLLWNQRGRSDALILCALFCGALCWTKNEGLAMGAINLVLVFLAGEGRSLWRRSIATAAFALIVAAIYLAWPIYTRGLPRTDEDYASLLTVPDVIHHLDRVPMVMRALLAGTIYVPHWSLFWLTLVVLQLFAIKRSRNRAVAILWSGIILQAAVIVAAYCVVTIWDVKELLAVSGDRMLLHLTPPAAFLIGLLWPGPQATPIR